jgi:transcriptional regulator with XRE-family HTH domain
VAKREAETMGERLGRLRRAAGLTQAQLADRAGVSVATLRNWEQDHRAHRLEKLLGEAGRVAAALGVSLDTLAGLTPPASPDDTPPA